MSPRHLQTNFDVLKRKNHHKRFQSISRDKDESLNFIATSFCGLCSIKAYQEEAAKKIQRNFQFRCGFCRILCEKTNTWKRLVIVVLSCGLYCALLHWTVLYCKWDCNMIICDRVLL